MMNKHRKAFSDQRANAKKRGIGWQMTFAEWLRWWGKDIDRRGVRRGDLCMQRIADAGPYAIDNVRKGDGYANAKTQGLIRRRNAAARARAALEIARDQAMWQASCRWYKLRDRPVAPN